MMDTIYRSGMRIVFDILFPKFCVGCGRIGAYICSSCQNFIERIVDPICPVCEYYSFDGSTHDRCKSNYTIDGLISFFRYKGVVQKAIKQIKYRFVSDMVSYLVSLADVSTVLENHASLKDATVVPIPLHSSRQRFRGFNQAVLIGKHLANSSHLDYDESLLKRVRYVKPQVEMKTKKERLRNVQGIFEVPSGSHLPEIVLLVDDVFTTGATMREAAETLKRSGVKIVWGMTIAR